MELRHQVRHRIIRLVQFLELQVAPPDFEGACFFANAVDLQTDEALGVSFEFLLVGEIRNQIAIDPHLDMRVFGEHTVAVPFAILEMFVRDELGLDRTSVV